MVSQSEESVSPLVIAALFLTANSFARRLGLPHPTVEEILRRTKATRSRAYEISASLDSILPTLHRPVGRPPTATPSPCREQSETLRAISHRVIDFIIEHPGCVTGTRRRHYADPFRHRILELHAEYPTLPLARFAEAIGVPLETLESWLRSPDAGVASTEHVATNSFGAECHDASSPILQTVLAEWKTWEGTFTDFCAHLREHCHVPYGTTLIARILAVHRARTPARRKGRSPDERALRGAFETFFPNAQWIGDGTQLSMSLCGLRFDFNLELMVDPYSGAYVGASLRDEEDSEALVEALRDGKITTNASPLAVLLDNKPSNHTSVVDGELRDALRIRATVERPQNKAHVEGGFGLFKQTAPEIVVDGKHPRSIALSILRLVVMTFFRASNHRPRTDRKGRSRVDLHGETPTSEQVKAAKAALEERRRRQELARRTLEARQRPEVRSLLDRTFDRLGLIDPERSVRIAIARYPLDSILDGVSIFEGKRHAGTLPEGADARYLRGIVSNDAEYKEGMAIFEAMLRNRMEMRDRLLVGMQDERERVEREVASIAQRLRVFVDRACEIDGTLHREFWLLAIVDTICVQDASARASLLRDVSRRIEATFRVMPRERHDAVRFVVDRVVSVT